MLAVAIIIGFIWLIFSNIIEIVIVMEKCKGINIPVYSPTFLYENTKMNWFGCWLCFILIRLFIPINTLTGLVVTIIYYTCIFIKWLFTVGRKDDE